MNTTIVVVIVIVVVSVVLIASVVSEIARRRSTHAQERSEQKHDEAVETTDDQQYAGSRPSKRENEALSLRALPPERRQRYRDEWNGIQQRFTEVPWQAVQEADQLVQGIMREIGYPVDDFERRATDVSAEHPEIVRHYRSAHAVAAAQRRGQAEAEPLRQAAGDYRVLVDDLLAQSHG